MIKPKPCVNTTLYQSTSLSVSELVCLSVWMFANSSKMTNPASWNFEGWFPLGWRRFRLKNIWIRWAVSRKIACIVVRKIACILATLTVNFILSICIIWFLNDYKLHETKLTSILMHLLFIYFLLLISCTLSWSACAFPLKWL